MPSTSLSSSTPMIAQVVPAFGNAASASASTVAPAGLCATSSSQSAPANLHRLQASGQRHIRQHAVQQLALQRLFEARDLQQFEHGRRVAELEFTAQAGRAPGRSGTHPARSSSSGRSPSAA